MKWKRWDPAVLRYFIFRGLLSRVYLPILVIYMADQGLSIPQIAGVTITGKVASFLFEVPSGAVADTIGHRRALVISQLGQATSALLFLGGSLPWIVAATLTYFLFGSLLTGTGEALFFEYLKSQNREKEHLKQWGEGKAFSRVFNMVSVFVGGASYALSPALPFLICAVQFAVGAAVIGGFPAAAKTTSVAKEEGLMALLKHFPRAMRAIWQHRFVFWLVVLMASVVFSFLEVFFNDYLNQAIPSLSRATTISVANFVTQGVSVFAASLFAWIHLPPPLIFTTLGVIVLVLGALPLYKIRQTYRGA